MQKSLNTEIERKFLVTGTEWRSAPGTRIMQGYLSRTKERTVRVRVVGEKAYLTVKGETHGATRAEYEYGIPVSDAIELLSICEGPLIQKVRHLVPFAGFNWEVDEFKGENDGLVIAEIELESEGQQFEKPSWVGAEVTDDQRYYNSNLATNPFCNWMKSRKNCMKSSI